MPGKHETSHTGSSVLKTTTWGALIAFSAAILVAGLLGYRPWVHSGELGRPAAHLAEQSLPPAAHSATPAKEQSSTFAESISIAILGEN